MERVLVLSPHPDDEAIGCGGTIRRHVVAGAEVRIVFLTSGERGGHGRSSEDTLRMREEEARAAGRILGVAEVDFWREPDGALAPTARVVDRLRDLLEGWRPDVLYATHDGEMHPDHRATVAIVRAAMGSPPASSPRVLLYEVWTPLQRMDEIVDISEFLDDKLNAVRAHACQCAVLRFDDAVRGLNRYRGEMHSWPGGDYAEVFAVLA